MESDSDFEYPAKFVPRTGHKVSRQSNRTERDKVRSTTHVANGKRRKKHSNESTRTTQAPAGRSTQQTPVATTQKNAKTARIQVKATRTGVETSRPNAARSDRVAVEASQTPVKSTRQHDDTSRPETVKDGSASETQQRNSTCDNQRCTCSVVVSGNQCVDKLLDIHMDRGTRQCYDFFNEKISNFMHRDTADNVVCFPGSRQRVASITYKHSVCTVHGISSTFNIQKHRADGSTIKKNTIEYKFREFEKRLMSTE